MQLLREYRISKELSEKRGLNPEKAAVIRGECFGSILTEEKGEGGFGYDNLFYYPAFGKTLAEIDADQKNAVSHRGIAMRELQKLLSEMVKEK